ncbi:MAG: helix-turn-helix domain-containing protein [Vulcanimicrobiaceae bacterium]
MSTTARRASGTTTIPGGMQTIPSRATVRQHYARPAAELAALPDHALLRVAEAALLLACSYEALKKMIARREISTVALGAHRRVPMWAVRDYVQRSTTRARKRSAS